MRIINTNKRSIWRGNMKNQLIKVMQRNQIVDIMYMAKDGTITKRRLKLVSIAGESMQAYCFMRHAKRTFIIDNVLAIAPVAYKERGII